VNGYNVSRLANGIHVLSENIPHIKSFSLGFWVNTGSKNENSSNNGISHFIEHMMFKGTQKRSAQKLSDEIESLGGYLNAFTSKEHTCYYGRGLSQYIGKTFEVISDMILNSRFRENDIAKEIGVVIDELYDIEDSPEELVFEKLESNIYKGNTLQFPIIGTEKNILSFNREIILNYIDKYYRNSNLFIVVSGNVKHYEILKLADTYFNSRPAKRKIVDKKINLKSSVDQLINKDVQQVHAVIGKPVVGYNSEQRAAINVLSHILGEGSSSRLFQTLREKNGITYQINSFLNSFYNSSTFGVYFSTNPKNYKKAIDLVFKELEKFDKKPITKKEFERARSYIKGNVIMGLENTTNRMLRMAQSFIYFNRIKTIEETINELDSISLDEIIFLSKKLFNSENFIKTVIAPNDIRLN
jgi:predicted Zn-dependent peptidase